MLIKPKTVWLLHPADVARVRARSNRWGVKEWTGRRTVICRECASAIAPKTERRLSFKHFNVETRAYDLVGFLHAGRRQCEENNLERDITAFHEQLVTELLEEQPEIAGVDDMSAA
jgi:hypothetical protein